MQRYSITSSAMLRNDAGTVRLSALNPSRIEFSEGQGVPLATPASPPELRR